MAHVDAGLMASHPGCLKPVTCHVRDPVMRPSVPGTQGALWFPGRDKPLKARSVRCMSTDMRQPGVIVPKASIPTDIPTPQLRRPYMGRRSHRHGKALIVGGNQTNHPLGDPRRSPVPLRPKLQQRYLTSPGLVHRCHVAHTAGAIGAT